MSWHLDNQLLARLDEKIMSALTPHLAVINLEQGRVLSETHSTIDKVYFPHDGIISCVVELIGGGAIETGMIGKDGQFGAGPALDHRVSLNYVVVQVAGDVSVIEGVRFRAVAEEHPTLRQMTLAYEQFMTAQIQQTAACNAVHKVPARICKWLLRMRRLVGDELPLTQEFLAQMMGVRRTSVTQVAAQLQRAGLISYHRGRLRILDVETIEETACECEAAVNEHYHRVFECRSGVRVLSATGQTLGRGPINFRGPLLSRKPDAMQKENLSPLYIHGADALVRARNLPVGPSRNDLRQLAIGVRWLDKKGLGSKASGLLPKQSSRIGAG